MAINLEVSGSIRKFSFPCLKRILTIQLAFIFACEEEQEEEEIRCKRGEDVPKISNFFILIF